MEKNHLNCYNKIVDFLKPNKRGHYKTINIIDRYLHLELSDYYIFAYKFRTDRFVLDYSKRADYIGYTGYRVLVFFPNDNLRLDMPIRKAQSIPVIKPILNGQFKEKPICIKYYDKIIRKVIKGSLIVIVSLPLDSIIFEDGSTLLSKLSDY